MVATTVLGVERGHEHREPACPFCSPSDQEVLLRREPCFAMWTWENPAGSVMILPRAHRATPFDLTAEEWTATHLLLREVRDIVHTRFRPDGWNVGWNVHAVGGQSIPHVHLHLVPRYCDEVYAGRGIRWWFKSAENSRG